MKHFILIITVCVCLVGCQEQPQTNKIATNPAQQQSPPTQPPSIPKNEPTVPSTPSKAFLKGYSDGYFGVWLAPARWVVRDQYRNGWSLGAYDRQHNLPNRFSKYQEEQND